MKLTNLELAATYETLMKTPHIDNLILHKLANHVSAIESELDMLRKERFHASALLDCEAKCRKYKLALEVIANYYDGSHDIQIAMDIAEETLK